MTADQRLNEVAGHSSLRIVELDPQTDPCWEALITRLPTVGPPADDNQANEEEKKALACTSVL